jgi:hypothetical protein
MTSCVLADLARPSQPRLPGDDGINGVGLPKGRDPPQGRLGHFQLVPDGARGTVALQSSVAGLESSFFSVSLLPS